MSADTAPLLALARECGAAIAMKWDANEVVAVHCTPAVLAALEQRIRQDERERVEAEADQSIELAAAIEQRRAIGIAEAVQGMPIGGKDANMPTPFHAGYQLACEEIIARLHTDMGPNVPLPTLSAAIRSSGTSQGDANG
jgi:hypothetical protein